MDGKHTGNHLVGEQPRLFFVHFRGNADALALAQRLRAPLGRMNLARAPVLNDRFPPVADIRWKHPTGS
ncbi:DUF1259 domain-containing protein [Sphingomonas sp. URHD0057]|uniref:DUF1259 domain-containing protein n=1 Tax=Sphingomonas sp. URHD0057 TaxID=1380389 RepID=UPI0018CC25F0